MRLETRSSERRGDALIEDLTYAASDGSGRHLDLDRRLRDPLSAS